MRLPYPKRIPYPERIPYPAATVFAGALLAVQLLQHTDFLFAICCFAYILVATAAFNIAGGMYRPAGAYIFFNALLVVVLGLVVKAYLGEPAQSNLSDAERTIEIFLLSMVSMLIAAYIENRLRSRRPLLSTKLALPNLRTAYLGAVIFGLFLTVFFMLPLSIDFGALQRVLASIRNSNFFLPFAIVLGTIYTVQSTQGRKSTSPLLILLMILTAGEGLLTFSKQVMFAPPFCWVVGMAVSRYKLKPVNIITLALIVYVAISYATPYANYGRNFEVQGGTMFDNAPLAYFFLTHLDMVKKNNAVMEANGYNKFNYFDQPMGIFDRLQFIGIDDALITETDREGFFGYEPYKAGIENMVPTILWKNKPKYNFGNTYMHQLGGLANEDTTTGVAFSIAAESYHLGGIFTVLIVESMTLAVAFLVCSYLLGDVRDNPVTLVMVIVLSHLAPEGGLVGALGLWFAIPFILVVFAFVCKYVLPVISSAFERQKITAPVPVSAAVSS